MSDEAKARKKMQTGPTGRHVAANVRRLRDRRGLSTYQLSGALKAAGHPIAPSSITNIEAGRRRVDVDDLTALALVFGISPSALLLPPEDRPGYSVEVTGAGEVPTDEAWDWVDGKRWLKLVLGDDEEAARLFYELYGRPPGRRRIRVYGATTAKEPGERTPDELARARQRARYLAEIGPEGRTEQALEEMKRLDPEAWEGH